MNIGFSQQSCCFDENELAFLIIPDIWLQKFISTSIKEVRVFVALLTFCLKPIFMILIYARAHKSEFNDIRLRRMISAFGRWYMLRKWYTATLYGGWASPIPNYIVQTLSFIYIMGYGVYPVLHTPKAYIICEAYIISRSDISYRRYIIKFWFSSAKSEFKSGCRSSRGKCNIY